ncbi:hypothetical protein EXIGLDRAFT_777266 [Exidia glandulosa HHB12029]|uniref:Uncharacterized protein n=1 Tax=Exidia glandulosa HHB12029 TaxID=1314781 RepID=A0A165D3U4_EXIGL|nr:hypothetical protein EXIGLDRAFT_777266 [Exidia glandulosa HHB12029]
MSTFHSWYRRLSKELELDDAIGSSAHLPQPSVLVHLTGGKSLNFARYHAAASEVPHSVAITRIEQIATANNLLIVVGVIERDEGTLYCKA